MEPIADHHLCSQQALRGNILPFLRTADTGGEPAVIHCLAAMAELVRCWAWLVAARGLSPMEAIEAVEAIDQYPGGCSCRQPNPRRIDRATSEFQPDRGA